MTTTNRPRDPAAAVAADSLLQLHMCFSSSLRLRSTKTCIARAELRFGEPCLRSRRLRCTDGALPERLKITEMRIDDSQWNIRSGYLMTMCMVSRNCLC